MGAPVGRAARTHRTVVQTFIGNSRPLHTDRPLDGVVVNIDEASAHRLSVAVMVAHDEGAHDTAPFNGCPLCRDELGMAAIEALTVLRAHTALRAALVAPDGDAGDEGGADERTALVDLLGY